MIYKAHELLSHLNHLTLTATDGKEEWIGTCEQRQKVKNDIAYHELLNDPDNIYHDHLDQLDQQVYSQNNL